MTTDAPAVNAETAIKRYTPLEASIAEFLAKHENVVHDVTTTAGMTAAKQDRAECRRLRTAVEEARVEEKSDALAYGRKVDAEAKRITAIIAPAEDSYDAQIKVEEKRKELEKQARIDAERQRIAAIRATIDGYKIAAAGAINDSADDAAATLAALEASGLAHDAEYFGEFLAESTISHAAAVDFLRDLVTKKRSQEAEAAALAADRAALEAQRAELDAREAAQERERAALAEERAAIARERAELDAARAKQASIDAADRAAVATPKAKK